MARPLRLQAAGAHYHVGVRGNDKAPVFLTVEDRERFLVLLGDVVERYRWRCYAYCLMENHFHLALTTPEPNLGAGMPRLNQIYAQWFNHRHDRVGHLFEQRYWSRILEDEARVVAVVKRQSRCGTHARAVVSRHWMAARARRRMSARATFVCQCRAGLRSGSDPGS
jgi:putative transposase